MTVKSGDKLCEGCEAVMKQLILDEVDTNNKVYADEYDLGLAIMICLALFMTIFLSVKVVPTFAELFLEFGSELPGITKMMLAISDFMQGYWYVLIIGFVALFVLIKVLWSKRNSRKYMERALRKIPVYRGISDAKIMGKYSRVVSSMLDSGVSVKCYLKALKVFLKEMKLEKNIMFHISDEPPIKNISYYENALSIVADELKDYICGDALSEFEFYKKGYTNRPIVAVVSSEIDDFAENCDDYWVYYTNGELSENVSNRTIPVPSARNRVIGLQMYVSGAKGFLHWGYNYYYGCLSRGLFNPMINPCGYKQLAGASYIVYPDITGEALPSLRMKVFYEAINDYGALQLLESLIGKEAVIKFIEKNVGKVNYKYSPTNQELFEFRQKLNDEIFKNI